MHVVAGRAQAVAEPQQPLLDGGQVGGVVLLGPPLALQDVGLVAGVDHESGRGEHLGQEPHVVLQVLLVPADLLESGHPGGRCGPEHRVQHQLPDPGQRCGVGEITDAEEGVPLGAGPDRIAPIPLGDHGLVEAEQVIDRIAVLAADQVSGDGVQQTLQQGGAGAAVGHHEQVRECRGRPHGRAPSPPARWLGHRLLRNRWEYNDCPSVSRP